MAIDPHSLIKETQDIVSKGLSSPQAPINVPTQSSVQKPQHQTKVKSKYRHVAALHSKPRPSCLSYETKESPSFNGFRNLMVLTIVVMNLRLVVENARKYGLLISLKSHISSSDIWAAVILYGATPFHLLFAYLIERAAMEHAKGVVGRRKKTEKDPNKSATEKETMEFLNAWWWIAFGHIINSGAALAITSAVVYFTIHNPGLGTISELHAIIVALKTCSYAFTNRDLRHAMMYPGGPESALPDLYLECPYPKNVTLANLCYFWWAPTLVYQPYYPRTDKIRWTFVFKRTSELVVLSVFIWLTCAQYAVPLLQNSLPGMAQMNLTVTIERLMKLSTVSLIVWLAGFFAVFHSFLNALAEVMRFGDRVFYEDWWNSKNLRTYWSTWNKPVYHFMRRHVFSPLVGRGWSPNQASICVFSFSAILHELAIGVPTHSIIGAAFFGMLFQLPLISITDILTKWEGNTWKTVGNCVFWVNFVFIGQPLAAMIYFFVWQSRYGDLATSQS